MKISCDKEVFLKRLVAASRAVTARPNLDVLNGLKLSTKDGVMTITGSNLDMTIRAHFEVSVQEDGEVVLPARLLTNIVRALAGGEVTIALEGDKATISGGAAKFVMSTYPVSEFPRVSDPEGERVLVSAEDLARGIRQVAGAASDDNARPILTGVLFEEHEGSLRMVATDSYRLALCDLSGVGVLASGQKVIVPADALDVLARLMDHDGEDEKVAVCLAERDVSFEVPDGSGTLQIVTRLIEGDFPKYESLIPESSPCTLEVATGDLIEAVRRITQIAPEATTPVRLSQRSGGVDLEVKAQDVEGNAEESVNGDYEGEKLMIAFNPQYLLAGLEAVNAQSVILASTDELKPAVLRPAGRDDVLYLMMPVRIT